MLLAPDDSDRWAYAMYGIEKPMDHISAKGVMAGSVATLAILWMTFQGMGFVTQSSFIVATRLPISLHNYLASYTGLPSIAYQPNFVVNSRLFIDDNLFPEISSPAINSSVNFGQGIVKRLKRLEQNIVSSGIEFSNDTPTQGQYVDWFPTAEAHRKSIDALIAVKASMNLAQNNCLRFGLRNKKCAQFISTLKMEDTIVGSRCSKDRELTCEVNSLYRTVDGTCNNLDNPRWGSSMTAYSRVLFPHYADGIQGPRRPEQRGHRLPGPRSLSSALSRPNYPASQSSKTLAVMEWAQFVAHDISHTPVRKMVSNDHAISCCRSDNNFLLPRYVHPDCTPIAIPDNDPVYSAESIRCMNYVRSMPAPRPDCSFGPTEQMNQVSHYLDASTIYGSTLTNARKLRTFQGGRLRIESKNGIDYLPTADSEPASLCNDKKCYESGDFRVNFVPHLAVMHTVWHREHNKIAGELGRLNPLWNDEILYQEARRIVIAEIQHITYNEWLPVILGNNQTRYRHIFPVNENGASHIPYNRHDNPSTSNEAATAAFRFINSLVQGNLSMHDEDRAVTGTLKLHEHFSKPEIIEREDFLDSLIRGLTTQSAQKMDTNLVPDMTHKLYKTNGNLGMDSLSLDIQRGRDHGIPGYNFYRKYCGLPFVSNFDGFLDTISPEMVKKFSTIYDHPNDIDLVVGGMAETPNGGGGLLGPTFSCLISEQFARLRRTDRFFYDYSSQPHPFTGEQLNALRNVSLARIFCNNGDSITTMQPYVFLTIQFGNELVSCDDYEAIPSVDLFAWAEKAKAYR